MTVDYTQIFDNPDQLADFLMLPNDRQDKLLAEIASRKNIGLVAACRIDQPDKERTPQ